MKRQDQQTFLEGLSLGIGSAAANYLPSSGVSTAAGLAASFTTHASLASSAFTSSARTAVGKYVSR